MDRRQIRQQIRHQERHRVQNERNPRRRVNRLYGPQVILVHAIAANMRYIRVGWSRLDKKIVRDHYKALLSELELYWSKRRITTTCKTIKEQLIARAWHPDRLEKWLEMGYDPDD